MQLHRMQGADVLGGICAFFCSLPLTVCVIGIGDVLLASSVAVAETALITDTYFYDASWVHELRADSDTGSQPVTRQVPPEDPTGYQEGMHNWGPGTIRTAHFHTAVNYTPSRQGPADSFDISFAFRMPYGSPSIKEMQAGLTLRQNGQVYVYGQLQTYPEDAAWVSFARVGLLATDFGLVTASGIDFNTNPDFSCAGSAIEFGYTAESTSTKSNSSLIWNVDDFSVAVHYTTTGDCNGNGASDECDIANGTIADCDGNNIPDDCQPNCDADDVPDVCEIDPTDPDGDGIVIPDCNGNGMPDNCETDCNGNNVPDDCDIDPADPDGDGEVFDDCDGDTVPDDCQPDDDVDGYINTCELCPNDPDKQDPGICGCGVSDVDTDGDGAADCDDQCPIDPEKAMPGLCGCGTPDTDTDGDSTPDCDDLCVNDPGKTEPGICGCGTPDTDTDGDATPDCNDQCPDDSQKIEPGICGCGEPDTDSDGDGLLDCMDNCPYTPNPQQDMVCDLAPNIVCVRWDATGANTGRNWIDAYTDLQSALSVASSGGINEIWVAQGTYRPTNDTTRGVSFQLVDGVGLYGGFKGTEVTRDQRDPDAYTTILSGDLLQNDIGDLYDPSRDDNSLNVLTSRYCYASTVLDGFTITGGEAAGSPSIRGGGLYVGYGSPTITNCVFTRNAATYGGGIYNYYSQPTIAFCQFTYNGTAGGCGVYDNHSAARIINCEFIGNTGSNGGAIYNTQKSHSAIINCLFVGNTATMRGSAICLYDSTPTIINCTLAGNQGNSVIYRYSGGYTYLTMYNSIVWGNSSNSISTEGNVSYSCMYYTWWGDGTNNIKLNPQFIRSPSPGPDGLWDRVNDDYGDLHLLITSPCFNTGDASQLPADVSIDLDGNPRVQGVDVDMGAYELQDCNGNGILDTEEPDTDGDLVIDECDNCPVDANIDQSDIDSDGLGDVCDPDRDGDGIPNDSDNCPDTENVDQANLDGDEFGDACDDDLDGDGVPNDSDQCPLDPNKSEPGQCGCGNPDMDNDADTIANCVDNCPDDANTDQSDRDGDTIGDVCDDDIDGDGTPNDQDGCPIDPNRIDDVDSDGDGILDCDDNCPIDPNPNQDNICSPGDNVLCVKHDAYGANDGSNWFNAYPKLQDALDHAYQAGGTISEIWVAAGTYHPPHYPNTLYPCYYLIGDVALYGGFAGTETSLEQRDPANHVTIISGDMLDNDIGGLDDPSRDDNTACLFKAYRSDLVRAVTISGFTITSAGSLSHQGCGIGPAVYLDHVNATLSDCIISRNIVRSSADGVVYCRTGTLTLERCTFIDNYGGYYGSAVHAVDLNTPLMMRDCVFTGNLAQWHGGALYSQSPTLAVNCVFDRNTSVMPGTDGGGGAVYIKAPFTFINCRFTGNRSGYSGGAIYQGNQPGTLLNCFFSGNSAGGNGGAVFDGYSQLNAINCTFAGNDASEAGAAIYVYDEAALNAVNCIVWGNTCSNGSPGQEQIYAMGPEDNVYYCCIQDGWGGPGTNNISLNPRFVRNPYPGIDGLWDGVSDDFGDLHLQSGSPCLDAGNNAAVPGDIMDLDGDSDVDEITPLDLDLTPRFLDTPQPDTGYGMPPIVDIGVYEFGEDCNGNGTVDTEETDTDLDGWIDDCDNCPTVANADQMDIDGDGQGDVCDDDIDGDGVTNEQDNCPNTLPGITVDEFGCPPLVPGDFDRDGDVDNIDLPVFQSCVSGPTVAHNGSPTCEQADFDADNDVDQSDFSIFQRCYSGQNNPADPDCGD